MENMNTGLISAVVGATVAIICVAVLLVPIVDDQTDHTRTFVNSAYSDDYIMTDAVDSSVTFAYDSTDGYTVNGESVTAYSSNFAALISDNISVKFSGPVLIIYDEVWNGATVAEFSLTAADGNINGTYVTSADTSTTETVSTTYEVLYYQDADGAYVTNYGATGYYLKGDTEIFATGVNESLGSGTVRYFQVSGSIDDGFTFTYNSGATEVTEYTLTASAVSGVDDVYYVTGLSFDVSDDLTVNVDNVVIPASFTVLESDAGDKAAADALYLTLPVLVLLVVVIGMVSYIYVSREN